MESVLLVDGDPALAETLRTVLYEVGYNVMACPDVSVALDYLRDAPEPVVVLLTHGDQSGNCERVLAAISELPPHAFLLLSTTPEHAPEQWNPHTRAFVPVLPMPFDLDLFMEQVAAAQASLKPKHDAE